MSTDLRGGHAGHRRFGAHGEIERNGNRSKEGVGYHKFHSNREGNIIVLILLLGFNCIVFESNSLFLSQIY